MHKRRRSGPRWQPKRFAAASAFSYVFRSIPCYHARPEKTRGGSRVCQILAPVEWSSILPGSCLNRAAAANAARCSAVGEASCTFCFRRSTSAKRSAAIRLNRLCLAHNTFHIMFIFNLKLPARTACGAGMRGMRLRFESNDAILRSIARSAESQFTSDPKDTGGLTSAVILARRGFNV